MVMLLKSAGLGTLLPGGELCGYFRPLIKAVNVLIKFLQFPAFNGD